MPISTESSKYFLRSNANKSITLPPELAFEHSRLSKFLITHDVDNLVPSFPAVANKLMAELNSEDVNLDVIEEHVKMDPAILGALYKRAHSVQYAGAEINSIPDAILRIGITQFKQIVITFGIQASILPLKVPANWDNFWIHGILVGRMTEQMHYRHANNTGYEYISGLLHDVGKLVLQKVAPTEYTEVMNRVINMRHTSQQAELAVFGFAHSDISAVLCKKWGMNDMVCASVLFHHDPACQDLTAQDALLAACISVADDLANYCGVNIAKLRNVTLEVLENSHTWNLLRSFPEIRPMQIDMEEEMKKIEIDILEVLNN